MSHRSRQPSANSPYNANDEHSSSSNVNLTPEDSFRANLFPMLKSEERILFHYADDLFQKHSKLKGVMSKYIEEFINVFSGGDTTLTPEKKYLFLSILRVINPPKKKPKMINTYLGRLVKACNSPGIIDIIQNYQTTAASMLIKCINEKVYEETVLQHLGSKGKIFHFLKQHDDVRQQELFLTQLNSMVFEELVALGLDDKEPVLCAIHLPQAGDVMLRTGKRVEIKVNKGAEAAAKKASTQYYVLGNNNEAEHQRVTQGVAVHFTFHNGRRRTPCIAYLNDRAIELFDRCIESAIALSRIHVPRGVSVQLLDLLGLRAQAPVNEYLRECATYPLSADGVKLPVLPTDAKSVIRVARILPPFMASPPAGRAASPAGKRSARAASPSTRAASPAGRAASPAGRRSARAASPRSARIRLGAGSSKSLMPAFMQGPKAEGRKTSRKKSKKTKKKGKKN